MSDLLPNLDGASIRPDGHLVDHRGRPTGLHITRGGHELIDGSGRVIGSVTLAGAVYDSDGLLIARVRRLDCETP